MRIRDWIPSLVLLVSTGPLACVATTQYVLPTDAGVPTAPPAPSLRLAACASCAVGTDASKVISGFAPIGSLGDLRVEIATPYRCSLAGSAWGSCSVRISVPSSHLVELRFKNLGDRVFSLRHRPILLLVEGRASRLPVDVGPGSLGPGESLVVSFDLGSWDSLGDRYALDLSGPPGSEMEPVVFQRYRTRTLGLFARP